MAVTSIKIAIRMEGVPQAPEQGKRVLVPVEFEGQSFVADLNAKSLRKLNKQAAGFEYPAITAIEGHFGGIEEGAIKIINAGCQVFEKKPKEPKPASESQADSEGGVIPETLAKAIEQVAVEPQVKPDPLARPEPPSVQEAAPSSVVPKRKTAHHPKPGNCSKTVTPSGTYELPPNLLDAHKHRTTKARRAAEPFVPLGAATVANEPFSVA